MNGAKIVVTVKTFLLFLALAVGPALAGFSCDMCQHSAFTSERKLAKHQRDWHTNTAPCLTCGKRFTSYDNRRRCLPPSRCLGQDACLFRCPWADSLRADLCHEQKKRGLTLTEFKAHVATHRSQLEEPAGAVRLAKWLRTDLLKKLKIGYDYFCEENPDHKRRRVGRPRKRPRIELIPETAGSQAASAMLAAELMPPFQCLVCDEVLATSEAYEEHCKLLI